MKANIVLFIAFLLSQFHASAQSNLEKVDKSVANAMNLVDSAQQNTLVTLDKLKLLKQQAILAIQNVKDVTKVFDPVVWLHGKNKKFEVPGIIDQTDYNSISSLPSNQYSYTITDAHNYQNDPALSNYYVTPEAYNTYITTYEPESSHYNTDGTANLGSQNHTSYGCYVDIMRGTIMDDIDASADPRSVDLIFTATDYFNYSVPMYAFLTPSYAKHDKFAYNYFKGTKYNDQRIPPLSWDVVNESEVAFAPITGEQFDKIQNNKQLMAIIKMINNFSGKIESRTKLDGKVIAIKTTMGDRTAYGLMHIVNHYGTTGPNGYLKVRFKVLGFDASGNGYPDPFVYQY